MSAERASRSHAEPATRSPGDRAARWRAPLAIRACAAFDLLVTGALALPFVAPAFLRALYAAEGAWLGGAARSPALPGIGWLFVNLAGALGVLWALVRLARPEPWLGRADALGRCGVAALIAGHLAVGAAPRALVAFVVTELAGAAWQALALRGH